MKCNKPSFLAVSVLVLALLPLSSATLNARDASIVMAAAQTAKQQCIKVCRDRYRACISLKQIPPSECRGVSQDCIRFTCDAIKG